MKTIIAKITTNNYENSNNKKKKTKSHSYIQKSLSSKRTSPIKIQMLNILIIKLLHAFFNIKPKWCHILKCVPLGIFHTYTFFNIYAYIYIYIYIYIYSYLSIDLSIYI